MPRPSGTCATPCRATDSGVARARRLPPSTTSPVRRTVPETARSVVVLPAPFAPSSATISPSSTVSDTPWSATTWPYRAVTSESSSSAGMSRDSFSCMVEVEEGLYRVTFSLPLGIDHVHCYLVRSSNGGFILVDTGLGSRDPEKRWRPVLDELDAPVEAIVVTHMHPDHVGGARDIAGADGRAGVPGPHRPRAVRARVGRAQPAALRRLLGVTRHAARDDRRDRHGFRTARRRGALGRAPRSPARRGRRGRRLARARSPGPRRRPHRARARRRRARRRHDPDGNHAGDRALSELAARPARRLPRVSALVRGACAACGLYGPS